ncbi:hypothetical protein [Thermobacillus sp. ZCTH02-B1]|uniref:hypothetical protein n=1 Tax=Thermobacillus sp. ZCTH02-B1 TaxID=1858795 RepID=UPI0025E8C6B6|nr:hypothetical protein [Thermobacillus sp. ZCTH02-B1]
MRRCRLALMLAVAMVVMLVVSACGNKKEPMNEVMRNALSASTEMTSFTFDGSFAIDKLELPPGQVGEEAAGVLNTLRSMTVSVEGAYVQDPFQMEMNMKLTIPGDLALTFEVPIILTADKMYVRVPDIPMFPLGNAAGKFIEIDLAELAEGQPVPTLDVETQRKLSAELLDIVMRHLEEETYFRELKKDEVPGLPSDLKADRYVKFTITQDNFDAFMIAVVERIVPEYADLLLNHPEYRAALGTTEEEVMKLKESLPDDPDAFRKELDELKDSLRIGEISLTGAIKGDYLVYQVLKVDLDFTDQGETTSVAATFDIRYDNINEDVTFKYGIPTDTIPMEELGSILSGAGL